jgi:hypothetical protein
MKTPLSAALDALADRGDISRARNTKGSWQWKPKGLGLSASMVRQIMDAVRADACAPPDEGV